MTCQHGHRREGEVQLQPIRNLVLEEDGWLVQYHAPSTVTAGKILVQYIPEPGLDSEPVWTTRRISSPVGFKPPTFQPVVIRYTD